MAIIDPLENWSYFTLLKTNILARLCSLIVMWSGLELRLGVLNEISFSVINSTPFKIESNQCRFQLIYNEINLQTPERKKNENIYHTCKYIE